MTPMMTTGHRRLQNGLLLRLDIERGNYVGTLYGADLTVKRVAVETSIEEVNRQIARW